MIVEENGAAAPRRGSHGERTPAANIYDVARLAGVSATTVSRVLNDRAGAAPATRDRIHRIIREVGFERSWAATSLATRRTKTIGIAVDAVRSFATDEMLRAVGVALSRRGHGALTIVGSAALRGAGADAADGPPAQPEDLAAQVRGLVAESVDAVAVVVSCASSLAALGQISSEVPVVVLGSAGDSAMVDGSAASGVLPARFPVVGFDQRAGVAAAMEHLIDLGHTRILHLGGPVGWLDAELRRAAWSDALRAHSLPALTPSAVDWTADAGHRWALESADVEDATAIFAANDLQAIGLLHGLAERGIRVPHDISVVGFDGHPHAAHAATPLTTVRLDFACAAERAADLLCERPIETAAGTSAPPAQRSHQIMPELLVGESTCEVRRRRFGA